MNKIFLLVSMLILSLMLSGCRKSVDNQIKTPALKKLKTITSGITDATGDVTNTETTFEYNTKGKLSRIILFENYNIYGQQLDTTNITYSRDSVKVICTSYNIYYPNSLVFCSRTTQNIVLNSNGFISTSVLKMDLLGNKEWVNTYQYDGSGNCIIQRTFNDGFDFVSNYKYSGGNIVSCVLNSVSNVTTEEMTYYLDKINTISPDNTWFDYFGRESKNLVKTIRCLFNSKLVYTNSYEYEFDANNYVTKRIMTSDDGYNASISWDKYTYQ